MKTATAKATCFCLCLTAITLMLAFQSSAQLIGSDARVIFLFDENGGDTAKDFSDNGNDGDIKNAPDWVEGKFGTALELNGKDNVVVVEVPNDLPTGAAPRTICFWFKWADAIWPDALYEMMGYGQNSPGQRLGLGLLETAWNSLGIENGSLCQEFLNGTQIPSGTILQPHILKAKRRVVNLTSILTASCKTPLVGMTLSSWIRWDSHWL